MSEESFEGVGAVGTEKVYVEARGGGLLLNGEEDGAGVLEDDDTDEEKTTLEMEGEGFSEEKF